MYRIPAPPVSARDSSGDWLIDARIIFGIDGHLEGETFFSDSRTIDVFNIILCVGLTVLLARRHYSKVKSSTIQAYLDGYTATPSVHCDFQSDKRQLILSNDDVYPGITPVSRFMSAICNSDISW